MQAHNIVEALMEQLSSIATSQGGAHMGFLEVLERIKSSPISSNHNLLIETITETAHGLKLQDDARVADALAHIRRQRTIQRQSFSSANGHAQPLTSWVVTDHQQERLPSVQVRSRRA